MSAAEIVEQFRLLPFEEQREVVRLLNEEIDDELSPDQIAELERRAEDFRKNPEDGVSWEQIRSDLRKRYGWK
jgi:putative addiction module component (TIGR02574 family)